MIKININFYHDLSVIFKKKSKDKVEAKQTLFLEVK